MMTMSKFMLGWVPSTLLLTLASLVPTPITKFASREGATHLVQVRDAFECRCAWVVFENTNCADGVVTVQVDRVGATDGKCRYPGEPLCETDRECTGVFKATLTTADWLFDPSTNTWVQQRTIAWKGGGGQDELGCGKAARWTADTDVFVPPTGQLLCSYSIGASCTKCEPGVW